MDEIALNKKLAEWAGFRYEEQRFLASGYWSKRFQWHCPDGSWQTSSPDFPESLDACFKWLVPKLDGWALSQKTQGKVVVARVRLGGKSKTEGNNPASLALCLAIEKLIDSGAKNGA